MKTVPYWHADAFADRAFAGNQAAVMILDSWPDDALLAAIGAENNFAETAFVVKDETGASDWELRWFTPPVRPCDAGGGACFAGAGTGARGGDFRHAQGRATDRSPRRIEL